jgi:hypothetical protein
MSLDEDARPSDVEDFLEQVRSFLVHLEGILSNIRCGPLCPWCTRHFAMAPPDRFEPPNTA